MPVKKATAVVSTALSDGAEISPTLHDGAPPVTIENFANASSSVKGPSGDCSNPNRRSEHESTPDAAENDDELYSSGSEEDEDDDDVPFYPAKQRPECPVLPETVTKLETQDGAQIYIVGTAHFSESSQKDVTLTIQETQPDVVLVELCESRVNILRLDEETLLREAKNINLDKIRTAIGENGFVQGIMHILLLTMSAHLTKQLGMAPGGEFRTAFRQAQKVPGCRIHLGDRPIQITLRRAIAALSTWQKLRLTWYILTSREPISKEEVEKYKQKDMLEEMLEEMTGEFPALSNVFVQERDAFLANSLRIAADPRNATVTEKGQLPTVVVGVVGIGHVPGIVQNWGDTSVDIAPLLVVPSNSSLSGQAFRWSLRIAVTACLAWGCYRLAKVTPVLRRFV